jgi:hypothetical protein
MLEISTPSISHATKLLEQYVRLYFEGEEAPNLSQ